MKVIISDSLHYYSNLLVPSEENDCAGLLTTIIGSEKESSSFKPTRVAAELIFDEVCDVDDSDGHVGNIISERVDGGVHTREDVRRLIGDLCHGAYDLTSRPWLNEDFMESKGYMLHTGDVLDKLLPPMLREGRRLENEQIFLSPDPFLNRISTSALKDASDGEMLLRLASSGVRFVLPSMEALDLDVVREFREKHSDLREKYLEHWTTIFRICRISEDDHDALAEILKSELRSELRKLDAALKEIEKAVAHSKQGKLERLRNLPVSEGAPGIFGAFFELFTTGSPKELSKEIIEQAIRLFKAWKEPEVQRNVLTNKDPAATYLYEMKQLVN